MSSFKQQATKPDLSQQVIWLTGASSGIGEALVKPLAEQCKALIISARNQEKLQQVARLSGCNNIVCAPADITDRDQLHKVANVIEQQFGGLHTLIANAGTCEYVDVQQFDAELFERVIHTNLIGLANCVEAALPLLRKSQSDLNQRSYIVGMSSSVAYLPLTRAQAYGASKAATNHFLEAMKIDLAPEQMDVSVICPGFVKTPLTDQNDFDMPMRISAEQAADEIIKGIKKRDWEIHFPRRFTRILKLIAALPSSLRMRLTQSMSRQSMSRQSMANNKP